MGFYYYSRIYEKMYNVDIIDHNTHYAITPGTDSQYSEI